MAVPFRKFDGPQPCEEEERFCERHGRCTERSLSVFGKEFTSKCPLCVEEEESAEAERGFAEWSEAEARRLEAANIAPEFHFKASGGTLLRLSARERDRLKAQIHHACYVSKDKLAEVRAAHAESLKRTRELRREIESCTIERVREYNAAREALQGDIDAKAEECLAAEREFAVAGVEKEQADYALERADARLDAELRDNAVIDLSERGALLADELLETLTETKRRQAESDFLEELNRLNQKDGFVSRIEIDGAFNIRCFKKNEAGEETESDAARFSKGEKQIYIMALYFALMKTARVKAPFVIDTPFARIDSVHRARIAKRFFKELPGQVIIFSTDEEFENEV